MHAWSILNTAVSLSNSYYKRKNNWKETGKEFAKIFTYIPKNIKTQPKCNNVEEEPPANKKNQ